MSILVNFNNRQILEPGSYSRITAGFQPASAVTPYGDIIIVDTGSGSGYGFGGGVNGQYNNGHDALHIFATALDAKKALRGGLLYDLMDYLWNPSNDPKVGGPNTVSVIKAATTTAPVFTFNFQNNAGTFVIYARNEGVGANGVLLNSILTRGYGVKMRTGVINTSKYYFEFYEGRYRGADANGVDFETPEALCTNNVFLRSAECGTLSDLITWANNDPVFKAYFGIASQPATINGLFASADLTAYGANINVFTGGTTVYNASDVDAALLQLEDAENALFLCDDFGIAAPSSPQIQAGTNKGGMSSAAAKLLAHISTTANITDKIMFIGGGKDSSQFVIGSNGSQDMAVYYNSENVVVCHSDVMVPASYGGTSITNGLSVKWLPTIYHAAIACGLAAGLEPQVPITQKAVRVIGCKHVLSTSERKSALTYGVLHLKKIAGVWKVNEGINTLQANTTLYNADGSSFRISTKRIKHQLNKDLALNAAIRFPGGNYNTVDSEDIKIFTEGLLHDRCATKEKDNLIISYKNVVPTFINGAWSTSYCFVNNEEIGKTFHTGFILDPNVALNSQQ